MGYWHFRLGFFGRQEGLHYSYVGGGPVEGWEGRGGEPAEGVVFLHVELTGG